jgi:hypothetical protein
LVALLICRKPAEHFNNQDLGMLDSIAQCRAGDRLTRRCNFRLNRLREAFSMKDF